MVAIQRCFNTLFVASIASAYVQFNNDIALHRQYQETHTPWHAIYLHSAPEVVTMDVDGRSGSSYLDEDFEGRVAEAPRCNEYPVTNGLCTVNVLFAVSKCLDTSTLILFSKWMDKLASSEQKFLTGGKQCDVVFSTVLVADCTDSPHAHHHGGSELSTTEIANYFTPFGNVFCSMAELGQNTTQPPSAVVSLFNDKVTHDVVTSFEQDFGISTVFNFHICPLGTSGPKCVEAHSKYADDSVLIPEEADLFLHNPFKAVQSFHCAATLPNGLPVVYVDRDGSRQCFCKCPSGFEESIQKGQRVCIKTPKENCACYWSGRKYEYAISRAAEGNSGANKCHIDHLYPNTLNRIPYPRSNYVSLGRTNEGDSKGVYDTNITVGSPQIHVEVLQVQPTSSLVSSTGYSWTHFVENRDKIVNNIQLSSPGIYSIKMAALGYRNEADCEVCLAVVDRFRPASTVKCPKTICDQDLCLDSTAVLKPQDTAEYTAANIKAAQALVSTHVSYSNNKNVINDACGEGRCDDKRFSRKEMFESGYTEVPNFESGATCFTNKVTSEVIAKLKQSPFGADQSNVNQAHPVPAGQCTRCCKYDTKLKEYWHNYQCSNSTTPEVTCSGSDPGCTTNQCLVGLGKTFFTASASINEDYHAATEELITHLYPDKGYQCATEIHLLLECSAFGKTNEGKCAHTANLHEMFTISSGLNDRSILAEENKYVYWRYRIDGSDWHAFNDLASSVYFHTEHSTVILEGWSQCGLVKKFIFDVYLHLNQKICINEEFDGMWYQVTSSSDSTGVLCNYVQSDFAELTFDFNPLAGLSNPNVSQFLPWVSTGVSCSVQYDSTRVPATLFTSNARNASLIKRFSFQMQAKPTTRADTTFTVTCSFSYASTYKNKTLVIPASKTFTIKNCDKPDWDCPFGQCSDQCALKGVVAPFSVCRGRTIFENAYGETAVSTDKKKCCETCGAAECQALFGGLNEEEDVYLCVVTEPKPLSELEVMVVQDRGSRMPTAMFTSACLFIVAGLLLAVYGQSKSSIVREMEEAYYPLLDH